MRILFCDDDANISVQLQEYVKEYFSRISSVQPEYAVYSSGDALLQQETRADIAFLDVEMVGMNGVELAELLKLFHPDINIIFSTGYGHYRDAAFDLHASGYLTKPITPEKVKKELENLRRPVRNPKRIRIRAFGNFEVYLDGIPINFKYNKTLYFYS
jgi:DNA-binding LytR/AlgR family response regulator